MNKILKFLLKHINPKQCAKYCGVKMGRNVFWATKYIPTEAYLIEIGSNTQITEGVKIFTHGGAHVARFKYPQFDFFGKVKIGNWCYIGTDSLILPGVEIGDHVLVAAGSVVTKSIPNNSVVGGNPAKIICQINEFIDKNIPYNTNSKNLTFKQKKNLLQKTSIFIHK